MSIYNGNYISAYCPYSSPEFTNLVEGILENTILNILKEAGSGQTNITAPIYTIAKAPDTNP